MTAKIAYNIAGELKVHGKTYPAGARIGIVYAGPTPQPATHTHIVGPDEWGYMTTLGSTDPLPTTCYCVMPDGDQRGAWIPANWLTLKETPPCPTPTPPT